MITYRRDYSKFFYLCFPGKTSIIMTQSGSEESNEINMLRIRDSSAKASE